MEGTIAFHAAKTLALNLRMENEFKHVKSLEKMVLLISTAGQTGSGKNRYVRGQTWWSEFKEKCLSDVSEDLDKISRKSIHEVESSADGENFALLFRTLDQVLTAEQKYKIYQFKMDNPYTTFAEMAKIISEKYQARVEMFFRIERHYFSLSCVQNVRTAVVRLIVTFLKISKGKLCVRCSTK